MSRKQDNKLIVGLDIGTSKVLAIVAELNESNEINIIGIGHNPAKGLRRGVVSDIESTVNSIQRAVEEAELMAGCQIYSVYVGIAGAHISSFNSHGVVAIHAGEVRQDDVERVIEAAQAIAIPNDQKILHVLPQEFVIDNQTEIQEPLGMSGVRLEARVHMITGADSSAQNIIKCVRRCGLEVDDLILEQLASSEAVLTGDERDLGVCMVDIGGGTTDIAIFHNGTIKHTAVIPIAGDQLTNDIAVALQTPTQAAEDLKMRFGCALSNQVSEDDSIEAPSVGGKPSRKLSRKFLAEVIEPRMEEIFLLVQGELRHAGFEELVGSVVITGGSSSIDQAVELAEEVFHMPVRLGVPHYEGGLSERVITPIYATGMGLIRMGRRLSTQPRQYRRKEKRLMNVFERMKSWFKGNF